MLLCFYTCGLYIDYCHKNLYTGAILSQVSKLPDPLDYLLGLCLRVPQKGKVSA